MKPPPPAGVQPGAPIDGKPNRKDHGHPDHPGSPGGHGFDCGFRGLDFQARVIELDTGKVRMW